MTRFFKSQKIQKTGLKLVLLALLSLSSLFSFARGTNVRVHYVFDNAVLRSDYLGNASVLSMVDSLVTSVISDSSTSLEIVSYSSPEGAFSYNVSLSRRRAEALRSYLVGRYPELSGRVVINPQGESWDEFRSMVASDSRLSAQEKDRVLIIIDSSADADVKEKQISSLPVYSYLYSKYFRKLRYAEFCIAANGNESEASNASHADSLAFVPEGTVVHYPLRGTVVDSEYLKNSNALSTIAALLGGRDAEEVNSIEIVSTSSIEGPESVNKRYAALRGSALRDYIVNSYPALAGKISVKSAGETWEDFRKAVESDPELSDEARSEILSVIVSDAAPDAKEAKLREMPEWDHLFEDIFPGTRYARLNATFCEKTSSPVKAYTYTPEGIVVNYRDRETGVENDYLRNESTLAAIEEMLKGRDAEEIDSIEITGYSSIEGSEADNARCAEQRAEALRDYIINKHPELEGKVKVKSEGEAWDDLRKAVEQDPNLSEKSRREILSVIDSDDAADVKEAKLRERKEWDRLKKDSFPGTDYARVETKFNEKPAEHSYTYTPEGVIVNYRERETEVDKDYLRNEATLAAIEEMLKGRDADEIDSIEITGYSSIEGSEADNARCAEQRAEALRDYIINKHPELEGKVKVKSEGEAWDDLRKAVEQDPNLSEKSRREILSVIDSDDAADVKEAKLRERKEWERLKKDSFPGTDYARVEAKFNEKPAEQSYTYTPEGVIVNYREHETGVEKDYMRNEATLAAIEEMLKDRDADEIDSIEITGYSSIEGSEADNARCAAQRAEALRDYIINKHPELEGKVKVKSEGEAWDDLRKAVEQDPNLSDKSRREILSVIDSDDAADVKEAKLRERKEWDRLKKDSFPGTDYARVETKFNEKPAEQSYTYTPEGIVVNYRDRETGVENDYLRNESTLAAIEEMLKGRDAEEIDSIEITGYSSIEGSEADNARCAEQRAEALRDYIINKHPELEGKVKVKSEGEAWDDLRKAVEQDPNLSEKSRREILSVIDSDDAADVKEAKLRERKEWERLKKDSFPGTDYARVEAKFNEKPAEQSYTYTPEGVIVNYRERETEVDKDYLRNEATLAAIEEMLKGRDAEEIDSIEITGYSSIEGSEADNARCAEQRAEALRDYIINKHPELEGKVKVKSEGEAWDDLRKAVEQDPNLSEKSRREILSVIDSDDAADVKEAKLRERKEWDRLKKDSFPGTDYAKVKADFRKKTTIPENEISTEIEVDDTEDIKVDDGTLKLSDTTLVIKPIAEPAVEKLRKPMFAASTNVVYDLAGIVDGFRWTPNISVELPIGNKWSTYAEYAFPWWLTKENDQAWQILKWDIGARRWLSRHDDSDKMDILSGHFLGIDLGAGYYDIEPKHKGWQGEFQTVGLEYGYAFKLSQAWRLEAYVGAGWMGTHYRYYQGDSTDEHLLYQHHGKLMWFGPTKAGVSIKYIFNKPDRRAIR